MSRWKPLIWFGVSLLCFVAAVYFWQWGERRAERDAAQPAKETPSAPTSSSATGDFHMVSQPVHPATNAPSTSTFLDEVFPYRLRNTAASMGELMRSDTALMLENALMDTSQGGGLAVPDHLRFEGDPGTYIAQARGAITEEFRQLIALAGGTVVSYVPNNAYLVRISQGGASSVGGSPLTQTVVPFEPYYKLKGDLLEAAVEQRELPEGSLLTVVLFPDAANETVAALGRLGGEIVAEDESPFGPVLTVQIPPDGLPLVAGLSGVQVVDRAYVRVAATDLARPRLGVADSSTNPANYLELTGENVVVQVVDSGVDAAHPDLIGRVLGGAPSLIDTDGHGTHVAGIIIGDGSQSTTVSNASGSVIPAVNGQFRGMAPAAEVFSIGAIGGNVSASDSSLQQSAAENGALISNNSWRQLGNTDYDIVAASYDAATRDALPLTNGSQPVLFVFAAGNEGFGSSDGTAGIPDTIGSPATAKNVITVGAIEQLRDLTNEVVICSDGNTNNCTTNTPFASITDSDDQVAASSSRGNVGIGLEGEFGRFKPDVVAPGVFVISTRSTDWATNSYYYPTNFVTFGTVPPVQPVFPGELWLDQRRIEAAVVELTISVTNAPGESGPRPEAGIPIYVRNDRLPTTTDPPQGTNSVTIVPSPTGIDWFFGVGNPTDELILVDITFRIGTTNSNPTNTLALQQENEGLEPWYRYESGTSMAAPAVSGTLALIQEYYVKTFGTNPSPALLKALLINGSRSVSGSYFYGDAKVVNDQGWGIFNLPNILPAISNSAPGAASAIHFYEQSVINSLVTAQEHTRTVTVDTAAQNQPLRFTLVWTDPPGSPLVAAKLVNNLDLIVTNLDSGEVYIGNNFTPQQDFTEPWDPTSTNALPDPDFVNNVENVYLQAGQGSVLQGTNFSVTVVGRRVNVNALTDHPDNTAQDYALVISSGAGTVDSALTVADSGPAAPGIAEINFLAATFGGENIQGALLLNQKVGENTPLLGSTNGINDSVNTGMTNQWRFYGITNSSGFTNATFVTFLASTLSIPRMGVNEATVDNATRREADIDLYVSQDAGLLTLEPTAVNAAFKSRTRGGNESIVLTNALPGVYYLGVKSEDHEAASYSLFSAFSLLPFSDEDDTGQTLRGVPVPSEIPNGSSSAPGAALVLGVSPTPINVRKVVVTNELSHQNFGDLIGNLSHNREFAVLNNHTFPEGDDTITNYTYIYDDLDEGDIPGSQPTDGPGSLRNFAGEEGVGVWLLTMVDDSLSLTGRVEDLVIRLERSAETNVEIFRTIQPFGWTYDVIEVPPDATNFTVCVDVIGTDPRAVELYIRRGDFPDFLVYDLRTTIFPPGDCASISSFDVPPLQPDNYYFGIFNPNSVVQDVKITVFIEIGLDGRDRQPFSSFGETLVKDDAVSYAYQFVEDDRRIAGLEVGLVLEHPRVSDLVTHLVSPTGKRILLVENRGGTDDTGYGGGAVFTNVFPTVTAGFPPNAANPSTNVLNVGVNSGTLIVDYNFFTLVDQMRVRYDDIIIKDTGFASGTNTFSLDFGPGTATDLVITMNEEGNALTNTAWQYSATVIGNTLSYLVLTEDTDKTTTPIKFAVPPLGGLNVTATGAVVFADGFEAVGQGSYAAPAVIAPWQVVTNDVDVFSTGYQGVAAPPEGNNFLDINGAGSGSTASGGVIETVLATLTPGRNYQLNFAYARNPDSVTNGVIPQAQVLLGTEVDEIVQSLSTNAWTNLVWQTRGIAFTAIQTNMVLQIASLTAGTNGVLFDAFEIVEATEQDRFYLPEESLNTLIGDSAEGLWTLEMWDNRVGAFTGPPTLKSWQLRFIYETVVQTPLPLEPGVAITNTIPPGEIFQLVVDVPNWASFATNTLIFATNDPVNVWVNPTNVITTTNAGDVLALASVNAGVFTLDSGSAPPLVPGGRYFVGIENPSANPVTFAYRVDFDITALTNGVPLTATLGTNQFGGFLRYFSYDVSTNNPTAVTFDVFNLNGDVDLLASFGQLPLPQFDYGSFNLGTNNENITVFPDSTPVMLAPGRWYLAVLLADSVPVTYTIQATELTDDFSGIITLTNAIPYTNSNLGVAPIEDFYRFMVTDPVQRLQFEILGPTADMTLLVNKGLPLPSFGNFDYLSANPGTNNEYILVLPGSIPVTVSAGEWFLTALNLSGQAADYAIKATQWAETGQPIRISTPILQSNLFCFTWDSLVGAQYVVQGKATLSDTNWVDVSGTITATDIVSGYCEPLPSPYQFFRVIEGVAVDTGSAAQIRITNISVGPGTVTLDWQAPPTFQFEVQYTDGLPAVWNTFPGGPITSMDGNFTFTDPGPLPLTTRFYRIVLLP